MRWGIVLTVGLLAGCASNTWYHPGYDTATTQRQFAIDDGRCMAAASGSAPMPMIPTPYPSGGSTAYTDGRATTYGPNGPTTTYYSGSTYAYSGGNAASSVANGYNLGNAIRTRGTQDRIYRGCMTQLGWTTDREAGNATDAEKQAVDDAFQHSPAGSLADYMRHAK